MKQHFFLILAGIFLLSLCSSSQAADTYEFSPFKYKIVDGVQTKVSDHDISNFRKKNYYTWGIDLQESSTTMASDLQAGEKIISASLTFKDIYDSANGPGSLYIHLLDKESLIDIDGDGYDLDKTSDTDLNVDDEFYGDYIEGTEGIKLLEKTDIPVGSENITTFSYEFTTTDLDKLNVYVSDNIFGLGFDPNSKFFNDGVLLSLTTNADTMISQNPEPATLLLMLSGFCMILIFKKRRLIAPKYRELR